MERPVVGLRKILWQQAIGRVAVVTNRSVTMAGFNPTIIFGAHDMAVETSTGVVGEIGCSARIHKREHTEANG